MCTVTYIPVKDKIFITHNRDEKSIRSIAIPPREYIIKGFKIVFPTDSQGGGTWIALRDDGSAGVLLNGAFNKHLAHPPYRLSRGLAFVNIMTSEDLHDSYNKVDLVDVEPFTVILWNQGNLYECRWDANQKHIKRLDPRLAATWSSVTLYGQDVIEKRNGWFKNWLLRHPRPDMEDIMQFHLFGGEGDASTDLRINRSGSMLTVSITSMEISSAKSFMKYYDLLDNTSSLHSLNFTKAPISKQ